MSNISTHCKGAVKQGLLDTTRDAINRHCKHGMKHPILDITGVEQQITIYNVEGAGINE